MRNIISLRLCIFLRMLSLFSGPLFIGFTRLSHFPCDSLDFMSAIVDLSTRQDALRTFLLRRLDNLTKNDKMQITMISTWATELYLDKVPTSHNSNVSAL